MTDTPIHPTDREDFDWDSIPDEKPEAPLPERRKHIATIPRNPEKASRVIDPQHRIGYIYQHPKDLAEWDSVIHAKILCAPDEFPKDPRKYPQTTIHHFRSAETGEVLAETATSHRRSHHPVSDSMTVRRIVKGYRELDIMIHEELWIADSPANYHKRGADPAELGLVRLRLGRKRLQATKNDRYPKQLLIPSPERTAFALDAHAKKKLEVRLSLAHYKRENPDDDLGQLAE